MHRGTAPRPHLVFADVQMRQQAQEVAHLKGEAGKLAEASPPSPAGGDALESKIERAAETRAGSPEVGSDPLPEPAIGTGRERAVDAQEARSTLGHHCMLCAHVVHTRPAMYHNAVVAATATAWLPSRCFTCLDGGEEFLLKCSCVHRYLSTRAATARLAQRVH